MPVTLTDRPIEAVRDEVIDQLIFNYSHGVISADAFERRLDDAMKSQSHHEIVKLVEDLDLKVDANYDSQKDRQFNVNYASPNEVDDTEKVISIMGGSDRKGRWAVPKNIKVYSIMGGSDIDFTDAVFQTPNVTVEVFCLFGGNNFYVPEDVNVISRVFCIAGGLDNKAPSIANRQAPTITIEGIVMFGGIDIKVKRTIKEKFVAFANELKTMFND